MERAAFGISVLWVVTTVLLNPVLSQLTIDGKVYDSELPEGCPANTQEYLTQFGYLNPDKKCTLEDIEAALAKFQELNIGLKGLEVTRRCDNITKAIMKMFRCGCEDIVKFEKKMMPNNFIGPQQYNIGDTKWTKKTLTWMVEKYPRINRQLTNSQVDDAMRRGLQIWADQTLLTFKQVQSHPADITIRFETRRHTRDPPYYDFDGSGGVLAHAFFPTSGVVHFDDDEQFVLNTDQGTELYIVAAHEFGHTLGISHSNINQALMAPYYRYSDKLTLHDDDIAAVQKLYGKRDANNPQPKPTPAPITPKPNPTTNPKPKYCNLQITATFSINGEVHVFAMEPAGRRRRKTYVYKVRFNRLDPSSKIPVEKMFQKRERTTWPRAYPYKVDAAEYIPDRNQIYLFSGTRVYRYTASRTADMYMLDTDSNYPRWMDVSEFPERPRSAIVLPYSGYRGYYMLIFGTTMVWDWNLYSERVGAWAFPISSFGQTMPHQVDAAYYDRRDDIVKFFKGDKYYNFSIPQRRVVDTKAYDVAKDFFRGDCA
ncbi:peptidase M10A [Mactra antiquata]